MSAPQLRQINPAPALHNDHQSELRTLFDRQVKAHESEVASDYRIRQQYLRSLENLLRDNADAIAGAISRDFGGRSRHETLLAEIYASLEAAKFARKHVKRWMKQQRIPVSIVFKPASAKVIWQPLGVVGIIVPWNYPVFLAASPLAGALAAGNRVMIKMSEYTPESGELFARLIEKHFPPEQVTVINGGPEVAREFSALPFDHLLFTGSTATGRAVMHAAADNLTPVTLELGGKSPAIVGPGFPIETAVARIMVGKCLNGGQTCIAPDYVMVPAGQEDAFVEAARREVNRLYPSLANNPDYTSIINQRHFQRLQSYLDDARSKNAQVVELASAAGTRERIMAPTIVMNVSDEMRVMQEEVFGPLLPVKGYRDLDEAIAYVRNHPRPLALYYFDYNSARVEKILSQTISGGVTINDTLFHVAQEALPFGGIGPSGMGHYHGHDGFATFSKKKPVFHQSRLNGAGLLAPPYGSTFNRMMKFLLR